MAAVNQDVFRKFQQLSVRQEADGTEVEVREDEEQGVKLQEIIDLLVAAGYFRARIKGLSPFDKVVGGMTWCIESCNVDVDVDLLFQENSTIGQKIALTEKIVAVLPKLKCPYLIEPHQIQGLDFIHIFPVIQWLVKRSMEFRHEMSSFVRTYAINQFRKEFAPAKAIPERETNLLQIVNKVHEVYRPHRYYKRKTNPPDDISSRVQITLMEYGQRGSKRVSLNDGKSIEEDVENESDEVEEDHLEQFDRFLSNATELSNEDDFLYDNLDSEDRQKLAKHYATLKSELEDGGIKSKKERKLLILEEQLKLIEEHCKTLEAESTKLKTSIAAENDVLEEITSRKSDVKNSLDEINEMTSKDPEKVKEVEDLVILNDSLRNQELQFREHCQKELALLQNLIETTKNAKSPVTPVEENCNKTDEISERLKLLRLQLAKKNRTIAALQRQLDDVPSRPELAQYQRRFLELYNQVAAKHKETKQYYTLYNTLEDTRQYMKREMSLMNSISESYPEAMQTSSGKEEFLKQFESIVESVRQSKMKVDRKLSDEKYKRDELSQKLQYLVELQRKYAAAVKKLSIECKKHEGLAQQTD